MCGICAAMGVDNQILKAVDGIKKLEYRGYDSSGIAFIEDKKIRDIKSVGEISYLEKKLPNNLKSNLVIAHTRWATHGKVNEKNAHPHFSFNRKFAIVHNGIIENYKELKKDFFSDQKFYSQTDTEVLINLISIQKGDSLHKLIKACKLVKGSFAIAMLDEESDQIYLAKRNSPLMVAFNEKECMAASDISVFAKNFKNCYILGDNEFAIMSKKGVVLFNENGEKILKKLTSINSFNFLEDNLNEKYFMLKEIKEQPDVVCKTYHKYFKEALLDQLNISELNAFKNFHFVACGTAYHSCLMGARYIQKYCKKNCKVSVASEFRYDFNVYDKTCLYVFVSQSGETADTIACAKLVKENGSKILCVTNVPYCSLNNIANYVLPTFAGKETAVASTKAYIAQVYTLLIFASILSKKTLLQKEIKNLGFELCIPTIDDSIIEEVLKYKKIFFIGRGQDYITSLEASLKLKEIAYINCLGIAAGELKHGTLALIDKETLVIAISTQKSLKDKLESNILEAKARGGKILLMSNLSHSVDVDYTINLQNSNEDFMPIISIIPLQLLAFECSKLLGFNPDKPRNLAKSVTVE